MAKTIIMGVDPGTTVTGYGIISLENKKISLVTYGLIQLGKLEDASHPQKLKKIHDRISSLVAEFKPNAFAIEAQFQGKNVQSMLKLGRAQGVAIAAALVRDIPVEEYAPRKIKQSVTGRGNATKEQVVGMLERLLDFTYEEKLLDAADGLATAVCHANQMNSPLAGLSKKKGWEDFIKNNPDRVK